MCIERGDSIPLSSHIFFAFTQPRLTRCILEKGDIAALVTRRCVGALVVNKLAADINARTLPVNDAELACLSAILGIDNQDMIHWLNRDLGAIHFANIIFLMDDVYDNDPRSPTSEVLGVVRQTINIISQSLPAQSDAEMQLDLTDIKIEVSKGRCEFVP
jgi:hypothetical protein